MRRRKKEEIPLADKPEWWLRDVRRWLNVSGDYRNVWKIDAELARRSANAKRG